MQSTKTARHSLFIVSSAKSSYDGRRAYRGHPEYEGGEEERKGESESYGNSRGEESQESRQERSQGPQEQAKVGMGRRVYGVSFIFNLTIRHIVTLLVFLLFHI